MEQPFDRVKRLLIGTITRLLSLYGYRLVKAKSQPTMERALHAIAARRHSFHTAIDIGASDGRWSQSLMEYFPSCQYLLIEANHFHEQNLIHFSKKHKNAEFVLAAAGASPGEVYFDESDPFGGVASLTPILSSSPAVTRVPVTTVDIEIKTRKLKGPYLIKLDTHGFEIPILKGAHNTLRETEVIVMECYNFRITPECLLFHEMCSYLAELDFRVIDLVDQMYRPYDNSLWQMDLVFIRNHRPEFSYSHYR